MLQLQQIHQEALVYLAEILSYILLAHAASVWPLVY